MSPINPTLTPLCPDRMRRLMEVVASSRADIRPLVTHCFELEQIETAYPIAHEHHGVLKAAIRA